jgi:hypothetical protein
MTRCSTEPRKLKLVITMWDEVGKKVDETELDWPFSSIEEFITSRLTYEDGEHIAQAMINFRCPNGRLFRLNPAGR